VEADPKSASRESAEGGFDWTERYPAIPEAAAALDAASAVIDGEAVWCDAEGLAIFDKLHSRAYDRPALIRKRAECASSARGRRAINSIRAASG
jgi:hypothetical protein